MTYRFVPARPKRNHVPKLRDRLDSGDIEQLESFGVAMTNVDEAAGGEHINSLPLLWDCGLGDPVA